MKKKVTSKLISFLPLSVGLTLLLIGASFVPWGEVYPYLDEITPVDIVVLTALSALFYFGRALRYWMILKMLKHPMSLGKVTLATMAAQPVAILPAGEIYRSAMLKRYGNVQFRNGLPSVFAQSVIETIGLLIIAIIGAVFLHQYAAFVFVIALLIVGLLTFIRRHNVRKSHKAINKIPKVNVSFLRLRTFLKKNRILLTGRNFIHLLLISYVGTFAGIAIVWYTVYALGGSFNLFESSIGYTFPLMIQYLSFLPGGIGVNENGSVGIFVLFGLSLPLAVAATIIIRLFTLGTGFIFGFAALAIDKIIGVKRYT